MSFAFSAIICTRDRYDLVPLAIESVLSQHLDRNQFEVVVVDNGDSAARAAEFGARYAQAENFQFIHEPNPGLSIARNTGAQFARGKVLAYLDDDAIASPHWLNELGKAYEQFGDSACVVGGPVDPIWVKPRPEWLSRSFEGLFSIVDWGDECREMEPKEWLAGCNYSVRRDRLLAVGGFRQNLGRKGALSLLSNEEIEASNDIRAQGGKVIYAPAARVKHRIDPKRLDPDWVRRRIAWQAVSDVLSQPEESRRRAEAASKKFARLSGFGRGLIFSSLFKSRKAISTGDYAKIYNIILVLLSRGG